MAGIEEAFKNFVNRVSQKEQREEKSAERGYQYGGGAIGFSGGGYPPVEEDNQSIEYGRDIRTVPTGFFANVNRPMPVYEEGQPTISGGLRDLRSMMSNINPQVGYTGINYGADVSAMMNPFTNMPKSYSANAYYGPEQDRYTLGLQTVPTVGAKQITAGYEGPYGNISLNASKDPMGRNIMANYNYRFADGGYISKGEPVDTNLTRTVPPVKGPNSQGVETLFKRRYS